MSRAFFVSLKTLPFRGTPCGLRIETDNPSNTKVPPSASRIEFSQDLTEQVKLSVIIEAVPEGGLMRRLVAALCIVALLFCIALSVSGADLTSAIPALVFCFFVLVTESAFVWYDGNPSVQPLRLSAVSGPRAPPQL